jgi:hypothetical protein
MKIRKKGNQMTKKFNKCFKFECSCIIIFNEHEDEKKVIKMAKKLTNISNFNVPLG